MKTMLLAMALAIPALAHPGGHPSIHNEEIDLDPARSNPPAENEVSITEEGGLRVIESNGIPDHETGRFPNRDNPNSIREQDYHFTMPLEPIVNPDPQELNHLLFGVALNGVPFDPMTAEFYRRDPRTGWNYEALGGAVDLGLDEHHGHVQPNGAYHYHGLPTGLFERLSGGEKEMTLIGWAADGFPIYGIYGYHDPNDAGTAVVEVKSSYRLLEGKRESDGPTPRGEYDGSFVQDYEYAPGSGDLDECNGRFGVTPEFPNGTYHYILTIDFPFIPRLFRGDPDPSFAHQQGPGTGMPGGGPPPGGPPPPPGRGGPPPPPRR